MAEIKKTYIKDHIFQPIELKLERISEAIRSIPGIIWLGIINVLIGYGYLFLPENAIIDRSLGSVNLEIVFVLMLISTLAGIIWSFASKKAGKWCKVFALILNIAAGIPWYLLLYMMIIIAIS